MTPYPMRLNARDFRAIRAKAESRKAKRAQKCGQIADLRALAAKEDASGRVRTPVRGSGQRKRKPNARKTAFNRLKNLCGEFVRLRAKHRTGGYCEVGTLCGGKGYIQVAYHVVPAATGNAVKYDPRNLLGACSSCNGYEFFNRKRGTYDKHNARHAEILGNELLAELKATAGRKQISTNEAVAMGEEFRRKIEQGEWE